MKRLILLTSALALAVACAKPAASTSSGSSGADVSATKPVATSGETPASAPLNGVGATAGARAVADREVTIPAGTILPVTLETSVGSDISRVEQPVHGHLRRAVMLHGTQVLPAGTGVSGYVSAARRPGKVKGRGYIAMRFTQIDTPGPGSERITTAPVGRLAPSTKETDAVKILAPAAAGAVIGRLASGKGAAAKGALIGGTAGTGYVLATRGKDVRLGKGAALAVKLTAPVTVRVGR